MKNILFAFSFFALLFASQTVEAQSQNIYRFPFSVDSIPASSAVYIEIPARLLSLWTLGGSFNALNLGDGNGNFTINVFGTSDDTALANADQKTKWQLIKSQGVINLVPAATSYMHFRNANEMFYLGHTRIMLELTTGTRPGRFSGTLVLKKD
jgi:hypothetical protein